ncbi:unnamed protein product, partial [Urochloa humidicola]
PLPAATFFSSPHPARWWWDQQQLRRTARFGPTPAAPPPPLALAPPRPRVRGALPTLPPPPSAGGARGESATDVPIPGRIDRWRVSLDLSPHPPPPPHPRRVQQQPATSSDGGFSRRGILQGIKGPKAQLMIPYATHLLQFTEAVSKDRRRCITICSSRVSSLRTTGEEVARALNQAVNIFLEIGRLNVDAR